LAPKFEIDTLPVLHILILMISLTELIYWTWEAIPESVSVNEAIELAKRFSDDQGKGFINWALSTFLKDRDKVMLETKEGTFKVFE
jgi:N utilization substance protein B